MFSSLNYTTVVPNSDWIQKVFWGTGSNTATGIAKTFAVSLRDKANKATKKETKRENKKNKKEGKTEDKKEVKKEVTKEMKKVGIFRETRRETRP